LKAGIVKPKKVLYISNVEIEGHFLPGVINKIKGQEEAFRNAGFEIDLLYPASENKVIIKKHSGERVLFSGARDVYSSGSFFSKMKQHYQSSWYGSIDFAGCFNQISLSGYDAIYLRLFLPGKDLVTFLKKIKSECPQILILLEYPTAHIKKLFESSLVRRVTYWMNHWRIKKLNDLSDYIITLTTDKSLFGKPAIFMANGIALKEIKPVAPPFFDSHLILLGVASDCAFFHGFDKVIKGIAEYKNETGISVMFRVVTNPLSKNVGELKKLAEGLGAGDKVIFENSKSRTELAGEYEKVHMGIGTLALHRINLDDNYSLKHREYAAFGLPFIMSLGDSHFEQSPFVMTVERNDEALNIQQVIDFYKGIRAAYPNYTYSFRESAEKQITWEIQMKQVFSVINNGLPVK
jgi:hypothetical protein